MLYDVQLVSGPLKSQLLVLLQLMNIDLPVLYDCKFLKSFSIILVIALVIEVTDMAHYKLGSYRSATVSAYKYSRLSVYRTRLIRSFAYIEQMSEYWRVYSN